MSMPADGINAILALNPLHLWTMRDTSGGTFADEVSAGALTLTAGAGCTQQGWGTIYGYRYSGGPQTVAPLFDGSTGAKATASGSPIGSFLNGASSPGWAIFAYIESTQYKSASNNTIYGEGNGSGNDRLAFFLNSGQPEVAFHADAGSTTTMKPPTNNFIIAGGSSPQGPRKGGQFIGVSVDTSGNVWFYRNGLFTATPAATAFPGSVAWTNTGITTAVGFDPANPSNSWFGALSWVCVFGGYISPSQFYQMYVAITPEPTSGNRYNINRSGKMFPNSQLWTSKLPDNAPVDPNSTPVMAQWMNYNAQHSYSVLQQVGLPMFDLDHTGRASTQGARLTYFGSLDENVGVQNIPIPDTFECEDPQPGDLQGDAISAGAEPSTGRSWDLFHVNFLSAPRTGRAPLWPPYITTGAATTGTGSLASGYYSYVITALTASGTESAFQNANGNDIEVHLTATGEVKLTMYHNITTTHPPVHYRVYRRGPYGVSTPNTSWMDYGLLTTIGDGVTAGGSIFPNSQTSATFTDNGTYGTPSTGVQPLIPFDQTPTGGSWVPGVAAPTTPSANLAGQKALSVASMYQSFAKATTRGGIGVGTLLTIGTGGTQELASVADVPNMSTLTLATNLANTHSAGETVTHQGNLWGGMGDEFESDAAAVGGGSSWDWWTNASFNPPFEDTFIVLNGQSATKKPGAAGVLMIDETCATFNATILGASLGTLVGNASAPYGLQNGGVVAGANISFPLQVTTFTPGATWTAVLNGTAASSVNNGAFYVGLIQHPVAWEMPKSNQAGVGGARRWPALSFDGSDSKANTPTIEGMRFRLPPGFAASDPNFLYSTIPQTAVAQMAFNTAVRDYGFIDNDSGIVGGGPYLEDSPQTGREEWPAIMAGQDIDTPLFSNYAVFTANASAGGSQITGLPLGLSFPATLTPGAFFVGPGIVQQTHVASTAPSSGIASLDQLITTSTVGGTFYTGAMMNIDVLSAFRFGTKIRPGGSVSATTATGSTGLTNVSPVILQPGQLLIASGVQHDTSVASVSGFTAWMNQTATASATNVTVVYGRRSNRTDTGTPNTAGYQQLVPY